MVNIAIQGVNGRMGRALTTMISPRQDCRVVAGVDPAPGDAEFPVYANIGDLQPATDVLIDFSTPEATRKALAYCADNRLACVICTTGLNSEDKQALQAAAQRTAVFYSANMSLGVNLLTELARRAQKALPGFDIEIVEKHHRNKVDAPSGTALALAEAINLQAGDRYEITLDRHKTRQPRGDDEIGIHAVRGGSIVGEHEVIFAGPDEVVTLAHAAYSREVFASGAIAAALYVAGKPPGLYSMQTMMEAL